MAITRSPLARTELTSRYPKPEVEPAECYAGQDTTKCTVKDDCDFPAREITLIKWESS